MGFLECCCPKDEVVVDLNMSIGGASLAFLFATLNVDWPLLFLLHYDDMYVVLGTSLVHAKL
jgi:hypothetical protein